MDDVITKIFQALETRGWMMTAAESCTGGMIASAITAVSGSSVYFDRGFVTYSNNAKMEMLSVPAAFIEEHGAVSAEVAEAMAKGALEHSAAKISVSVTGIAGPTGGSNEKPVGLVYIGVATWEQAKTFKHTFKGDRAEVRAQSTQAALKHLLGFMA